MKVINPLDQEPVQADGYIKQVLLAGKELQSEGTKVQIVTIEPGDMVADHYHRATFEFYFVLQGSCRLTVNGESSVLSAGDMLLMEPNDVHSLTNEGTIPFQVLVFKTNSDHDLYWASSLADNN